DRDDDPSEPPEAPRRRPPPRRREPRHRDRRNPPMTFSQPKENLKGSDPFRFAARPETATERAANVNGSDPFRLVAGVGCSLGCRVEELLGLIEATVGDGELVALATVDRRAEEPCVVEAARAKGVPLLTYRAEELAAVSVPSPSSVVEKHVGT